MRYVDWVKNAEKADVENFYVLNCDQKKKQHLALLNLCFGLVLLAFQLGAGFLNQSSSRTAWIFYPYILAFLPLAYFFFGAYHFFFCSPALSQKQYSASLSRCKHSMRALLVLSALQILLSLLYVFLKRQTLQQALFRELLYLAFLLLQTAITVAYSVFFNKNLINTPV